MGAEVADEAGAEGRVAPDGASPAPLVLDVWADLACPWCFIGHRNLDSVVAQGDETLVVRHRPYQLQPDLPPRGQPMVEWGEQKFGGADAMRQMFERVAEVGRGVGIAFDFAAMPVVPNTVQAHRALVALSDRPIEQRSAVNALFSAYFERGLDITDPDVVVSQVAGASGTDRQRLEASLEDPQSLTRVQADLRLAAELGISAVPTFVVNDRLAVQGAQPPTVLQALLDQARDATSHAR